MAGLEALTAMIYHERQQEGSMLCAQHALNSLLQGNYFTAPDLAAIAQSFDALEHHALEGDAQRSGSHNMDDTGFFSVQVIDQALDVWGLNLIRWRSEQMRPYQYSPHKLLAFVLNLQQHWFTLRRFGPACTDIDSDPGEGHWFNLNSSYVAPKWVSRTYLNMFLQQSEQEGYSVFAVVQADPSKPLALPRTEADLAASTLEAPDSLPGHSSSSSSMPGTFPETEGAGEIVIPDEEDYDINSEDVELQAALAASLAGTDSSFGQHAYVPRAPIPAPALRQAPMPPGVHDEDYDMDVESISTPPTTRSRPTPPSAGVDVDAEADPVAASMARNRQMLEHMRRMQEEALRETYEEEAAGLGRAQPSAQSVPAPQRRRTREEDEQEELERAIAASVAEHNTRGQDLPEAEDENDEEWRPTDASTRAPGAIPIHRPTSGAGATASGAEVGITTSSGEVHRVYDDEDEQLQEALRASLQTMPEGFVHPPTPIPPPPQRQPSLPTPAPGPSASQPLQDLASANVSSSSKPGEAMAETEMDATDRASSPPPPPAQVDVEEMRRRRLARFGGQGPPGQAQD